MARVGQAVNEVPTPERLRREPFGWMLLVLMTTVSTSPSPTSAARPASSANDEEHPFGKPPKDLPAWSHAPATRVTNAGPVRLETLDLGKRSDRSHFIDMTRDIYRGDQNFIAPLRMERMRFLDTRRNVGLKNLEIEAWLAYKDQRIVGRLTAHIDRAYDAYHGVKAGWFGFFESIDDRQVAHTLLDQALRWLKERGATEVIGPMNFTTNHQIGLLVQNFARPPFVEMTYNPAYYEALITSYGFAKAKDLYAFWIDVSKGLDDPKLERFHRISEKVKKRMGIRIRGVRLSEFEAEVTRLFKLYNECWQRNWGFVPVDEDEFKAIAKDLKQIIVESLVLIVEDKQGQPIAFAVSLPNVNEVMPKDGRLFPFGWYKLLTGLKKLRTARLFTLGVLSQYRKRGVESLLCIETALRAKALGINAGEIGWTLEDNQLINSAVESMGGRLDRRYRLFGLTLT